MIKIRKANFKKDINILMRMERLIFPNDYTNKLEWKHYPETYIIFVGEKPAGFVSVLPNTGIYSYKTKKYEQKRGSLHIAMTGVIPRFRRRGLGGLIKTWTVAYARLGKFKSLNATARKSNKAIIALNKKFGFKITREIRNFYPDGETAVVEELFLN